MRRTSAFWGKILRFRENRTRHSPLKEIAMTHEITLIAPGGIRDAIQRMIPGFERATGHKVRATFGSGGGTKQRVMGGEAFDVPVVQPPLQ